MLLRTEPGFEAVPKTAEGHFVLYFYAAIYHLLGHIERLSRVGGQKPEAVFGRYPFLGKYVSEMQAHMPSELHGFEAMSGWRQAIENWEGPIEDHLPLRSLTSEAAIGYPGCLAFMATGLVEEDSRFGTLFAELQAPLGLRRPTFELLGQMIAVDGRPSGHAESWTVCRALIREGLVEVMNPQSPRSEWVLRPPQLLWDAARRRVDDRAADGFRFRGPAMFPALSDLIYPAEFIARLNNLPRLLSGGKVRNLILRCDYGADPLEVAGALARSRNAGLISVDGMSETAKENVKLLGPLCTLTRSLPVLQYDLAPGETVSAPPLTGYFGPVIYTLGCEGGLDTGAVKNSLTINLPAPGRALRVRHWLRALERRQLDGVEAIAELFHLSGGYIDQVANIAVANAGLHGRERVNLNDVQQACRSLNRQHLDTLAAHLKTRGCWEDLVAAETTMLKLKELQQRCRNRETLLDHLGPAFQNNANRGVRALFTGVSGTGKTLAAKILAAELGLDLYRVDLAAVINKYIGETEKNLHQVLSRAEALDVVLLLDEGDALLGTRTEVKTANDRYANLETNYLLQRLENYDGIVLVTTNLGENIDSAFQRRMDVVVPFFIPQAEERLRILELHLPADHRVEPGYLEQVSLRCTFNGAQIRNASLHATLLALEERSPVRRYHLEQALRSEFRKAGGTDPLANHHADYDDPDGGTQAFIDALRSHGR